MPSSDSNQIFQLILDEDIDKVKEIVADPEFNVNCVDEHGTTPLMNACFKGNKELCEIFLKKGANVNHNEHKHGYTALMFAALSGKPDLCTLLLDHGAKTYITNSVGKTATEMAGFTGQHQCVDVINNYISLEEIENLVKPKGSRTEPLFPMNLCPLIHDLVRSSNVHPVHVLLFLSKHTDLLYHLKKIDTVFEDFADNQMKGKEASEVISFKLHMIHCTLKELIKTVEKVPKTEEPINISTVVTKMIKYFLTTSEDQNFPKTLEYHVRDSIRRFPHHNSVLFQAIVRIVSKTDFGSEPSAMCTIQQAVYGAKAAKDENFCVVCGSMKANKRCGSCKMTDYCSAECQKLHWPHHKRWCADMKQKRIEFERRKEEFFNPNEPPSDEASPEENLDGGCPFSGENNGEGPSPGAKMAKCPFSGADVDLSQIKLGGLN